MVSVILRTCYGLFGLYKPVNCQHEVSSHYYLIRNGYGAHGIGWVRREVKRTPVEQGQGLACDAYIFGPFSFFVLTLLCPDMGIGHILICFRPGMARPYALWSSSSWGNSFMPSHHKVLKGLHFQAPQYFNITSKTRGANWKFGNYSLSFNSNYNSLFHSIKMSVVGIADRKLIHGENALYNQYSSWLLQDSLVVFF